MSSGLVEHAPRYGIIGHMSDGDEPAAGVEVARKGRLQTAADSLRDAEEWRVPIPPLVGTYPDLTIEDAYEIQTLNIGRRLAQGSRILGRKVGLTSLAMQQMMHVNEPDFGVLLDNMFVEDGDPVAVSSLIQPRVEAEIALVLNADVVGPGVTSVSALQSIDSAFASIEIIDSRIADWKIGLVDTISDNASSGRAVISGKRTTVIGLDLRLVGVVLSVNGELVETGAGAAVLGNPARCVAWLANKLAYFGERLRAGDVILAGALHKAVAVKAGDSVLAEFSRLGSVHTRFV